MENTWKNKMMLNPGFSFETEPISDDRFGLFFCRKDEQYFVFFRPLNDEFVQTNFHKYDEHGLSLAFSREFIEEDVREYALDILDLFNQNVDGCLLIPDHDYLKIESTLNLLQMEYDSESDAYLLLKSLLKVLLLFLIRVHKKGFLAQDLDQKRIYSFLKLMESHYTEENTGEFYAQQLGISEKRLNQILKAKLDKTAKQIIQQRQITEIKRMLKRSESSIKEIAFQFHFDSLSDFSRFFKRHVHQSPSDYRNQV